MGPCGLPYEDKTRRIVPTLEICNFPTLAGCHARPEEVASEKAAGRIRLEHVFSMKRKPGSVSSVSDTHKSSS